MLWKSLILNNISYFVREKYINQQVHVHGPVLESMLSQTNATLCLSSVPSPSLTSKCSHYSDFIFSQIFWRAELQQYQVFVLENKREQEVDGGRARGQLTDWQVKSVGAGGWAQRRREWEREREIWSWTILPWSNFLRKYLGGKIQAALYPVHSVVMGCPWEREFSFMLITWCPPSPHLQPFFLTSSSLESDSIVEPHSTALSRATALESSSNLAICGLRKVA